MIFKINKIEKEESKINIFNLVSAFCWVLAIISAFTAFNEYQSLLKTRAFVTAAQRNVINTSAEAVTAYQTADNELTSSVIEDNLTAEQADNSNSESNTETQNMLPEASVKAKTYVINKNSKKIHSPSCTYANSMKEENKIVVEIDNLEEYILNGYSVCSKCGAK